MSTTAGKPSPVLYTCDLCWRHGPHVPGSRNLNLMWDDEEALQVHRAAHAAVKEVYEPIWARFQHVAAELGLISKP